MTRNHEAPWTTVLQGILRLDLGGGGRFLGPRDSNDNLGRREWVCRDGTAFAGDHADVWGYNDRNELDDSDRYSTFDPNSPGSPSDPNHAFDRAYAYDAIGNREWSQQGSDPNTAYTANNLNQYTATQDPNESFTYDDDGNLTQVGGTGVSPVNYTWDAENRLSRVQSGDPNSPADGDTKVEFVYDYMGRRVEKKVSDHNGTSWSVSACRRFVWSDWLMVLELDASDPNDPNTATLRLVGLQVFSSGRSGY